jgi:hypothetical protein
VTQDWHIAHQPAGPALPRRPGELSAPGELNDATVICRNDAVGAFSALRKGPFSTTFLQVCAVRSCHLQRRVSCNPLYLHSPGRVLVAERIDAHSRNGNLEVSAQVTGTTCGPRLPALAHQLALTCGQTITIDTFASESDRELPRPAPSCPVR